MLEIRRDGSNAGSVLGAVAGAGVGFLIGYEQGKNEWGGVILGPLCAIPGALLGGVAGHLGDRRGWEVISFEKLRVAIAPRRDGASAVLTLRF